MRLALHVTFLAGFLIAFGIDLSVYFNIISFAIIDSVENIVDAIENILSMPPRNPILDDDDDGTARTYCRWRREKTPLSMVPRNPILDDDDGAAKQPHALHLQLQPHGKILE